LHGDRSSDAKRALESGEIRGKPIPLERRARRNPRVLGGVIAPEVLMSIEEHWAKRWEVLRAERKPGVCKLA
jgi:hypothetical protein